MARYCAIGAQPRPRRRAWIRRASFGLMRRSLAISRWTASAEYRCPSASHAFARPSVRGGRGTSSVFRIMAVSLEGAVVETKDVRMGGPPGVERRSPVVERAFADRNNLKASVATVLVILAGEPSGLLASIGFGFVETRLKVCADGGIAVDAADALPFSDAINLIGHGLPSSPMGGEKGGEAEASPVRGETQNGMSSESSMGVCRFSCGSSFLSSPWFGPLQRRSRRSAASVTP